MENKDEILEENALGKTLGAAALATSMAFGGGHHNAQLARKPVTVQYQRCHAKNVWANPEYNKKVEKYLNEYLAQYPNNYWKALTLAEDRARNEVACGMTYKLKGNPTAKGKPMHETSNLRLKKALQEGYQELFGEECPESICEGLDDSPALESGVKDIGIGGAALESVESAPNSEDETYYAFCTIYGKDADDIDRMVENGDIDAAIEKYGYKLNLTNGGFATTQVPKFEDDSGNDIGFIVGTHNGMTLIHNRAGIGTYDGMYMLYREMTPKEKLFVVDTVPNEENILEF